MTTFRNALPGGVIVLVMFAGYVKASPALSWIPIDLTLLSVGTLILMAVVSLIRGTSVFPTQSGLLLGLAFAFAVPILWSVSSPEADRKMMLLFGVTLCSSLASAVLLSTEIRIWWLVNWFVIGSTGIAALLVLAPTTSDLYGRYALDGSNTIAIGRACGVGLVAAWLLMRSGRLRPVFGAPIALVLVTISFGSGSRGPLIAVAVAITAAAIVRPGARRLREVLVVAAVGSLTAVWAIGSTNAVSAGRILQLFSDDRGNSIGTRELLIYRTLEVIESNFQGVGWGGLDPYLQPLAPYPHNIVLEVFAEAGWIPGAAFVAVLILAFTRACRCGDIGVAIAGVLVYWFVNSLVSGDINDNRALFAVLGVALIMPSVMGRSGAIRESHPTASGANSGRTEPKTDSSIRVANQP